MQDHQPRRLHLRGGVGDPVLNRLAVPEQAAAHGAVQRALAEHVEGAPREPEPAHAVVDAAGNEPVLRDHEALALLAEQRVVPEPHVLVEDLGVPAEAPEAPVRVLHRRDVAHDVHAGRVVGTMNIDARSCGAASGSVTAMTIRKSAIDPFEVNHLWPFRT